MSRRIITTYGKLNGTVKQALKTEYPHGVDLHLTKMKNVIKGYLFDGLVFIHQDITYLIEWYKNNDADSITYFDSDIEDDDMDDMDEEGK
jgi:hypothetical protein